MDDTRQLQLIFQLNDVDLHRKDFFKDKALAHYTTAENAINILKGQIWLRNTRVMNDTKEIEHGMRYISDALYSTEARFFNHPIRQLCSLLEALHPKSAQTATAQFETKVWNLVNRTHVTCLSVHRESEDDHGRLSMWRAYTGNHAGVALIVEPAQFTQVVENPSFFSVPVMYDRIDQLDHKLQSIASAIYSNQDFIRKQASEVISDYLASVLRTIATASKHPGFAEEQEWRVMHTRGVDPQDRLLYETATVRGIPQIVAKLPIETGGPLAAEGITVKNLLRKVIIGPTNYPYLVAEALQLAMKEAGIDNAEHKIAISQIPLRMEQG